MQHREMSPSSLAKRLLCPGSYHAEKDLPDLPSTHSKHGVDAHKVWERLATGPELAHEYAKELNTDKKIHEAIDWTHEILQNNTKDKVLKVKVEHKIDLSFMNCKEIKDGTIDMILYEDFGEGQIYDWKFGDPTIAPDILEWQQKCYALGAMQAFGLTRVKGYTVFPLSKFKREFEFVALERDIYIKQIQEVEGRALLEIAPRIPGVYQCTRCKAFGSCGALMNQMNVVPSAITYKVERFGDIIEIAKHNYNICSMVVSRAEDILKGGGKVEGWKLAKKETQRWKRGSKPKIWAVLTKLAEVDGWTDKLYMYGEKDNPLSIATFKLQLKMLYGHSSGADIFKRKFDEFVSTKESSVMVRDEKQRGPKAKLNKSEDEFSPSWDEIPYEEEDEDDADGN